MAVLQDYQFEVDGAVFGLGCDVEVEASGFRPAGLDWRVGDVEFRDSVMPGRDYASPGSWSWSLFTNGQTEQDAMSSLAALQGVWRNRSGARVTSSVKALRYSLAGRTRVVYGRPRRWTPSFDNRYMNGMVAIEADFRLVDGRSYGDELQVAEALISPAISGGFDVPFEVPLVTNAPSSDERPGAFVVEGDAPAPALVRIYGPVLNPAVRIIGTEWQARAALPDVVIGDDEWIEIDSRPWVMAAYRNDGSPVSGKMGRSTRLSDLHLPPDSYEVVLEGNDITGTARATVSWRNAYDAL